MECSVLIILGLTNWNWSPNAGIDLHSLSLTRMEIFPTIIRQATYYITYSREAPISGRECWWPCRQRPGQDWVLVWSSIIHWPQLAASWSLYICLHRHPTLLFSVILPPADAVMALLVETMRGMYTIIDTAYNSRQQSEFGGGGVPQCRICCYISLFCLYTVISRFQIQIFNLTFRKVQHFGLLIKSTLVAEVQDF